MDEEVHSDEWWYEKLCADERKKYGLTGSCKTEGCKDGLPCGVTCPLM